MTKKSGVVAITEKGKLRFIREQAKLWIKLIEVLMKTYENHPAENRFLVKYEDLRAGPLEILEKMYKFIGIEISKDRLERIVDRYTFEKIPKEMRGKGKFARSASPGKWKDNFSEGEIKIMNEIMEDTLKRVGY